MIVAIPAVEKDDGWTDLHLLLHSLDAYASETIPVVTWKGDHEPIVRSARVVLIRQPDDAAHFGDACRFLIEQTSDADLLFLNDDCVVMPSTMSLLQDDLLAIEELGVARLGLVGLRSNYVAGLQNIRRPAPRKDGKPSRFANGIRYESEDFLIATDAVFGVAFYAPRDALRAVSDDWTRVHWWGDTLLSWDLAKLGYSHFVSRSYVHHHGSRSGGEEKWGQWDAEARVWIKAHRPEVAKAWGW